ncbi:hypothetical protein KL921_003359 [Ogataea angusta]|nr:hypothetical protein KL921_003359 [Ogataea angusta]KAG7833699.1 hypothetical protein KL943_003807 [Ogataea angusta]KAG7856226.1 hypothetical protein KL939_003878 [Ogataea angusta]
MSSMTRNDTTRLAKVDYCEENRCSDVGDEGADGEPGASVEFCEMVAGEAAKGREDDAERPRFFPEVVVVQSAAEDEVGDPHNNSERHGERLKVMHRLDELSVAESPCVAKPGQKSGKVGAQVVADHGDAHLCECNGEKLHDSVAVVRQLAVYVENIQCFGEHLHGQGREA